MSPYGTMLQGARMFAILREPKTFNNCLGSERGFWQRQTRWSMAVPKRRFFGILIFPNQFDICIIGYAKMNVIDKVT